MMLFSQINLISVFLITLFCLPIVIGLFCPVTKDRILNACITIISALIFVASTVVAVNIAEAFFTNNGDNALANLFRNVPALHDSIVNQDFFVYILMLLIIIIAINCLLHLLSLPLVNKVLAPLSQKIACGIASFNKLLQRLFGGVWQLSKSIWLVLVFSLLLSFYTTLSENSPLGVWINASQTYRLVEKAALEPIMASKTVQQIPLIVDNTVDRVVECLSPEGRKLLIKVYINGVTVEDAVLSSPNIDNVAIDLVGIQNDDYKKAEILYQWIAENISYDHEKAEIIAVDAFADNSGAVTAFDELTGVCFDKACLYVAMCRAAGVPVRLITGHAFNGAAWMDHSWNQIYYDTQDLWVNVDTTFGGKDSDYFDRADFYKDHKDEEIQGAW